MDLQNISKQKGGVSKYISQVIHNQILQKYVFSKDVFRKQSEAYRLEYYFNLITSYIKNLKNNQAVPGTNQFVQELINNGLPINQLFNYDAMGFSSAGFQFEKDLALIIQSSFNSFDFQNANILTGQTTTTVGYDFSKAFLDKIKAKSSDVQNKIVKSYLPNKFNNPLHTLKQVQGKIDLSVPSKLQINLQASAALQEFQRLLRGAKITAKNYTNMKQISLGKASRAREFFSVLEDLGYDLTSSTIIYNTLTRARGKTELSAHKYHLIFAYELAGMGQYYDINGQLQKLGTTDFLIVYDKSTQTIKVRSTAKLIYDILNNNKIGSKAIVSLI